MSEFKRYHPLVNFIYFVFVIGFSCLFMHPLALVISLVCSFSYSVFIGGAKVFKSNVIYLLLLTAVMTIVNALVNRTGVTSVIDLSDGNFVTLESTIYGFCSAIMLVSVIFWFSCYNKIMTSDKFIFLFGKIIPTLSLVFCMTLRFVNRFSNHLKVVINAQKCLGKDISKGKIVKRIKIAAGIMSIMVTWSMENAIETADSMKSRGYGLPGRTSFSVFVFKKRDFIMLLTIIVLGVYVFWGYLIGGMYMRFFPSFRYNVLNGYEISLYFAYFALGILPLLMEIREVIRWRYLTSKI